MKEHSEKGCFFHALFHKEAITIAGRIKGITVEIGGDTSKLSDALKGVNKEIKNTQSQLKDVEKLLKLDPGNTELLAQKHRLLGDAVKETKEKLETLKTAAEQANTALANGEISQEQYDALKAYQNETGNQVCYPIPENYKTTFFFLILFSIFSSSRLFLCKHLQ